MSAGMSKLMPGTSDEAREAAAAAEIPVGRMGRKWDIAMAVLYLASPAGGTNPALPFVLLRFRRPRETQVGCCNGRLIPCVSSRANLFAFALVRTAFR